MFTENYTTKNPAVELQLFAFLKHFAQVCDWTNQVVETRPLGFFYFS